MSDVKYIKSETAAYSILHSILTQVASTKKSYKTKFLIPYHELMAGIGIYDEYADASLQVEIKCTWTESLDDEQVVIEEDDEGGYGDY